MLQFLAPQFLLALSALLVPVAIHMLSRDKGPRLKVGSIRLLENMESTRIKSLKLEETGLLLLRALLLGLCVLVLARPFWQRSQATANPPGWVLISPGLLASEPGFLSGWRGPDGESMASLSEQNQEIRLLASGFPIIDGPLAVPEERWETWSLLREADHLLPSRTPVRVYSESGIQDVAGVRPTLDLDLQWVTVANENTLSWVERAYTGGDGRLHVILGSSHAGDTRFRQFNVAHFRETLAGENDFPFLYDPASQSIVQPSDSKTPRAGARGLVITSPKTAVIALYFDAESRAEDVSYLKAAFGIAAQHLDVPVRIEPLRDRGRSLPEADLIFWLSPKPEPDWLLDFVADGGTLWSDSGADSFDRVQTRFVFEDDAYDPAPGLWRRVAPSNKGLAIWSDGRGEPLLEYEVLGKGGHYRFRSRFHPLWSEWVPHPEFPHWAADRLRELVFPANARTAARDLRCLAESQILPKAKPSPKNPPPPTKQTPLEGTLWGMAALCFCIERWLSERRPA